MKNRLYRIIIAAVLFLVALLVRPHINLLYILLCIVSYVIVGGDIVKNALLDIRHGNVFDENFLMTIATIGAFSIGEYPEAVAVMLFYQIGEFFQSYAVDKSRKSISDLMDIRPDYANVQKGKELVTVDPDEVKIGDVIVIKPGEKVPLDAKVIEGDSILDTSALTGESLPREIGIGSDILSGCINLSGVITAEVVKEYEESTVSQILDLVENASSKKSKTEKFITRFSRYYTPTVVYIAILLAVIPPLIIKGATFHEWIYRALAFLVVSCPCALVISVPLSFFGGIGGASKKGILVKGSNYLEMLAKTEAIVFDKTGTLTKGVFSVQEINPVGISKQELLELATYAEAYSNHPISSSLKQAYGIEIDKGRIGQSEEIPGRGLVTMVDGRQVIVGNGKLMESKSIPYYKGEVPYTVVHVAVDNTYVGYIVIDDETKDDAKATIESLRSNFRIKTKMLTGDKSQAALKVANELGIDEIYAELLPNEKVGKFEELYSKKLDKGNFVFVGDGINDAPVLARADIGIAMGGLGSDAAIEAADIVIMTDEPSRIIDVIKISQKTLRIATQNAVFAITIKILVLILSAFGLTTLWAAVFADVGVTIIAILNSFRALKI